MDRRSRGRQGSNSEPDSNREPREYREPSKSARKRQMNRLQKLAGTVADLKSDARASLQLPAALAASIDQATKLKSGSAKNRQLRHAAKLLEAEDELLEKINRFFAEQQNHARRAVARQKTAEIWRDRLLDTSENALGDFFDEYPQAGRQELGTLVRNARREKQLEKPPAQQRKLFKYLRDQAIRESVGHDRSQR